jgi:hypothetical protein
VVSTLSGPTDLGCSQWDWDSQKCLACSTRWVFGAMVYVFLWIASAQNLTGSIYYVLLAIKDIILIREFVFWLKIMNLMI